MTVRSLIGFHEVSRKDHAGRRMYCGRYALVAATGEDSQKITAAINSLRRRKLDAQVKGTTVRELRHALGATGVKFTSEYIRGSRPCPTFTQWRHREQHGRRATYILLITGHWIVVRGDWLTDTFHEIAHDLSESNPYARKRVQAVIRIGDNHERK
jgi:hypothetical protein